MKEFHRSVVNQSKEEVRSFLEPQQLGMSVAGAQKFVVSVRSLLNHRKDFICVKIDFCNAYNKLSRRAIVDALVNEPTLRHLAHFSAVTLAPVSGLEAGGTLWGEGGEGGTQGNVREEKRFQHISPGVPYLDPTLIHLDPAIWGPQGCSWSEMAFLAINGAKNGTFWP